MSLRHSSVSTPASLEVSLVSEFMETEGSEGSTVLFLDTVDRKKKQREEQDSEVLYPATTNLSFPLFTMVIM